MLPGAEMLLGQQVAVADVSLLLGSDIKGKPLSRRGPVHGLKLSW